MWKHFKDLPPYSILFTKDQNYNISVTNFIKIWNVVYSEDEFISRLQESNFALEIGSDELLANSEKMLSQPEHLKSIDVNSDQQQLKVVISRNFGYPLKLMMTLQQGSCETFFTMVTQSLLKTIQDLRCSETELRNLLKCKDKEIEEYKAEAGEVVLRYLKTKPFNDTAHMEKHTVYEATFGVSDIPMSLLAENNQSPSDSVNQEKVMKAEIKTEPESQLVQMDMQVITDVVNVKAEKIKTELNVTAKKRKIKLNL